MLIVRKEAEEDMRAAYDWYEKQRENLGRAFLVEVARTFEAMEGQPEAYAPCFKSARRALCKRFPYAVYFTRDDSDIIVIAVLHQRRHPMTWQNRT
jgi:plasmid stabilization system protein ParE